MCIFVQYMVNHELYMRRCLDLATLGLGYTAPNPLVGAVLVHNGSVIGEGWHKQYGAAHAEVNCFDSVLPEHRTLISESTLYVSLEPCAHFGKTPPCALRIIAEGVKDVVIANEDPFPAVAGKGIELLRRQGILVTQGVLEAEGRWLNRRFFRFVEQKRPYIILKWAQTRSGIFAPADRSRFQISNSFSSRLSHRWRTEEAAILVGYNTALHDDPRLTSRLYPGKHPLRIVIDRDGSLPPSLRLFDGQTETWVVNAVREGDLSTHKLVKIDFDEHLLEHLCTNLYEHNIQSLIVEGGASLLSRFISQGLWDEARIFVTPDHLDSGIRAPVLTGALQKDSWSLAGDRLDFHIRA